MGAGCDRLRADHDVSRPGQKFISVTSSGELSRAFDHPAPARSVAAAGSRLAWGYTDSTLLIVDTSTGDSWSIRAHTHAVDAIALSTGSTYAVSASQNSVRVWDLRRHEPKPQTDLPCSPFHLVRSPASTDRFAIDCPSGEVWTIDSRTGTMRLLHRHSRLAFGLAWHGATVCSGSWDGTVLCTHADSGVTHVVARHASPVRWLAADDDVLLHATADGSIWLHDGGNPDRARRVATLGEEPYRAPDASNISNAIFLTSPL